MTYYIERDFPIEQLNPLARREVKVKRALNAPGAFRGRIINAENIGKSSGELVACRTACGEPAEPDIDI